MKSVVIPVPLHPLPKEMLNLVACTCCSTRPAKWELGPKLPSLHYTCSICLLYEQPFVRDQREAVDALVDAVEANQLSGFPRAEDKRLVAEEDADRVAGGIAMAQRYERMRGLT